MVQVDVFWSYGLGATLAVAGSRQLLERRAAGPADGGDAPASPSPSAASPRGSDPNLLRTLLFLALIFVPSGAYLVWSFPSWETMHVGDRDMPGWLIAAFTVTNVTQGLLGYVVVDWLLGRGRTYIAYLQIVLAYFAMFLILVHGWDGTGYQRFFSATRQEFLSWSGDWQSWLSSDVALTLYGMAVVLVPALIYLSVRATLEGYRLDASTEPRPGAAALALLLLATVFGAGLTVAIAAHLAIAWLGAGLGIPAAIAIVALAYLPGGPVHRLYRLHRLPVAQPRLTAPSKASRAAAAGAA